MVITACGFRSWAAGSGTDETFVQALRELRERILAATVGQVDYAVGGRTATAHDFAEQMTGRAPLVFVLGLLLASNRIIEPLLDE